MLSVLSFSSCVRGDPPSVNEEQSSTDSEETQAAEYKVIFRQGMGFDDVVITVKEGEDVPESSIPVLKDEPGYKVSWDRTVIKNVKGDMIVEASRAPIRYKLRYYQQALILQEIEFTVRDLPLTLNAEPFFVDMDVTGYYLDSDLTSPITQITKLEDASVYITVERTVLRYEYDSTNDAYIVSDYVNVPENSHVVIPDKYNGKRVIAIKEEAFSYSTHLDYVEIPSSITLIEQSAFFKSSVQTVKISDASSLFKIADTVFYGCELLTQIKLPSTVEQIGYAAFADCKSLTELELPSSLKKIGDGVFVRCSSLEKMEIPASVTEIGINLFEGCKALREVNIKARLPKIPEYTFHSCHSLVSVAIPNGPTEIGIQAFQDCMALRTLTIPSTVNSIGQGAFEGCTSLIEIYNPSSVPIEKSDVSPSLLEIYTVLDGKNHFIKDGDFEFYEAKDTYYLISYLSDSPGDVLVLPSDIKGNKYEINKRVFANNKQLQGVHISSGVSKIGVGAFFESQLSSVTFEQGVTEIGAKAFEATKITEINLPSTLTVIGDNAFKGTPITAISIEGDTKITIGQGAFCYTLLESIDFSQNNIESLGACVFASCEELVSVKLPENSVQIPNEAFMGCKNLESVQNSENVSRIGDNAFAGCVKLRFTVSEKNYQIGVKAFSGCIFEELVIPSTVLISERSFQDAKIERLTVDTATVPKYAFSKSTVKEIVLTDTVTSVAENAFLDCSLLERVVIGNGLTKIPNYAFDGCTNLFSVTLGEGIEVISSYAFADCFRIAEIYNFSDLVLVSGDSQGNGAIAQFAFAIYTEDDGVNHIIETDDKAFVFYLYNGEYVLVLCRDVKENLIFPDMEFDYFLNTMLLRKNEIVKTVTIPDCVTEIGPMAISECPSLNTVIVGNGVSYIGIGAFMANPRLIQISLGSSVEKIDAYAFSACTSLKSITVPASTTLIGSYAFYGTSFVNIEFENTQNWYAINPANPSNGLILNLTNPSNNAVALSYDESVGGLASYYLTVIIQ